MIKNQWYSILHAIALRLTLIAVPPFVSFYQNDNRSSRTTILKRAVEHGRSRGANIKKDRAE
jgi:hypothetical protein